MVVASGVRICWHDLPGQVRAALEAVIGGRVVEVSSQTGGFSPGTADRVRTSAGRRAFVKAVSSVQNAHTPQLHRREARITAALPRSAPTPRLLGSYDDGEWVALVLEDVEGRHPATPWLADELASVLATLQELAELLTPSPIDDVLDAAVALEEALGGWQRLAADPPDDLDVWSRGHLDQLCGLAERADRALTRVTLTHNDVRGQPPGEP